MYNIKMNVTFDSEFFTHCLSAKSCVNKSEGLTYCADALKSSFELRGKQQQERSFQNRLYLKIGSQLTESVRDCKYILSSYCSAFRFLSFFSIHKLLDLCTFDDLFFDCGVCFIHDGAEGLGQLQIPSKNI